MKWRTFIAAAVVAVGCIFAPVANPAMADLRQVEMAEIARAEKQRAEAIVQGDVNALKLLLGSQYYHVESNGRIRSKVEFLQAIERGDFAFVGYRIEHLETELFGELAVVRGMQVVERNTAPEVRRYKVRYLRVWQRSGPGWVNTMHQATEVRNLMIP